MSYVCKVQGNFNTLNFGRVIDNLSTKCELLYLEDTLFVSLRSYKEGDDCMAIARKYFKAKDDFAVIEINKGNISFLSAVAKDWCLEHLVKLDTERYELENQDSLKERWKILDKIESELKEILNKQQSGDCS